MSAYIDVFFAPVTQFTKASDCRTIGERDADLPPGDERRHGDVNTKKVIRLARAVELARIGQ